MVGNYQYGKIKIYIDNEIVKSHDRFQQIVSFHGIARYKSPHLAGKQFEIVVPFYFLGVKLNAKLMVIS